jgi:putative MATE family efflux protein
LIAMLLSNNRDERRTGLTAGAPEAGSPGPRPRVDRMLEGPVLPTLLRLAAPTIALMAFQVVVSAGEEAFVGRLGSDALAGVSLSFPLVMLMTTLSAGAYGGGVASSVARALGAGRTRDAGRLAGTALGVAALLGAVTTAVMLASGRAVYSALGATGPALDAAVRYSDVMFLGAVPSWIFNAAASVLRGGGNAAYPAAVGAVGGAFTLAASPLLIFGAGPVPGLGLTGAAVAVVVYNAAAAAMLLRAVLADDSPARPTVRSLVPARRPAVAILKIAIPSAGNTVLSNLTFLILTGLVAPFGVAATAGYGAGGRLEYLLITVVFGIGSALVPIVAASVGAGDHDRARRATRAGALLGTGACGLAGMAAALAPWAWMRLFSADTAVVAVGEAYLRRAGLGYPFLGLGMSLYFAAQGRGRVVQPLLASLTRLLVAGVGGAAAVGLTGCGLNELFVLMAGGLLCYGLVMVAVMRRELGLAPDRR